MIAKPVRLIRGGESFRVVDAHGRVLSYTYFEDEPGRAMRMGRLSEREAKEVAQEIARCFQKLSK